MRLNFSFNQWMFIHPFASYYFNEVILTRFYGLLDEGISTFEAAPICSVRLTFNEITLNISTDFSTDLWWNGETNSDMFAVGCIHNYVSVIDRSVSVLVYIFIKHVHCWLSMVCRVQYNKTSLLRAHFKWKSHSWLCVCVCAWWKNRPIAIYFACKCYVTICVSKQR